MLGISRLLLPLWVALLSLTSCVVVPSTRGSEALLDDAVVGRIQTGTTRQQQVRELLGKPTEITQERRADGTQSTVWHYRYFRQGSYELIPWLRDELSKPTITRTLDIYFSDDGIVRDSKLKHTERSGTDPDVILIP